MIKKPSTKFLDQLSNILLNICVHLNILDKYFAQNRLLNIFCWYVLMTSIIFNILLYRIISARFDIPRWYRQLPVNCGLNTQSVKSSESGDDAARNGKLKQVFFPNVSKLFYRIPQAMYYYYRILIAQRTYLINTILFDNDS